MSIQAKVARDKELHPERYCPARRCLWRTGGGACPRHKPFEDAVKAADEIIADFFAFEAAVRR